MSTSIPELVKHAGSLVSTAEQYEDIKSEYRALLVDGKTGEVAEAIYVFKTITASELASELGMNATTLGVHATTWLASTKKEDGTCMVSIHDLVWAVHNTKGASVKMAREAIMQASNRAQCYYALKKVIADATPKEVKEREEKARTDADILVAIAKLVGTLKGDGSITAGALEPVIRKMTTAVVVKDAITTPDDMLVGA